MRSISIVMAYYNNPEMLKLQFKWMRGYAPELREYLEYVVVDDGSKKAPALPPEEPLGMGFQLFRIGVDVRWNQDAARNIGVEHAKNEWVLLTDQDHLVPEPTLERVMKLYALDEEKAYRFSRLDWPAMTTYKLHPNSWLMTRKIGRAHV